MNLKTPREEEHPPFKRILVGVDGSPNSERAARVAVELAVKYVATLEVLHAIPRLTYEFTPISLTGAIPPTGYGKLYMEARSEAQKYVDDIVSKAKDRGIESEGEVLENVPSIVQAITNFATEKKVDLIVVGTRGKSGFTKLLVGSVSSGVVAHAHCPVLVVR